MNIFAKACISLMGAGLLAGAAFADHSITVEANKSKAMRLKGEAAAVVVGNPNFADVAVHDSRLIFVTGKALGQTNLLVFDKNGREIFNGDIIVKSGIQNTVNLVRAGEIRTHNCSPNCRGMLAVGDDHGRYTQLADQIETLKELSE